MIVKCLLAREGQTDFVLDLFLGDERAPTARARCEGS